MTHKPRSDSAMPRLRLANSCAPPRSTTSVSANAERAPGPSGGIFDSMSRRIDQLALKFNLRGSDAFPDRPRAA